jgi:aminomethyltransferase
MGEFELAGPSAEADLERLLTMRVGTLRIGQCRYGYLLRDDGGVLDDLTCYRLAEDRFMLVVNAGTTAGDAAWIRPRLGAGTRFEDLSPRTGKLDVQGPESRAAVEAAFGTRLPDLRYFHFAELPLLGRLCLVSRTGYTGEWGYEIYFPAAGAADVWNALVGAGAKPAGLGARDTLRLEAGLCLYGHDINEHTTPVEAGLTWAIQKVRRPGGARAGHYPGAHKIAAQLAGGVQMKRVGLVGLERIPVREGAPLVDAHGHKLGHVTSGTLAPTVNQPIAMAYLAANHAIANHEVYAEVRGKRQPMRVTAMPFVPPGYFRG